jgi:DNA invertase Pin-like site-specific DNA recombinase
MAAEPGPNFRWGALLRASKPKRVVLPDGTVKVIEESTDRQDLELIHHIRDNNMGVIVESYKDVASAWQPGAKRPRYKHALVDLATGYIDGIACLAVDRLTRRRDQVRPILNAMEEMGGRLFFLWDGLDTASDDPDKELRLHELVARAEREAERTSQRYKLVAQHRARKGLHHPSGRRAFGHTHDYRQLVVPEAEMLFQAAKEVDQGKATHAIVGSRGQAQKLRREGGSQGKGCFRAWTGGRHYSSSSAARSGTCGAGRRPRRAPTATSDQRTTRASTPGTRDPRLRTGGAGSGAPASSGNRTPAAAGVEGSLMDGRRRERAPPGASPDGSGRGRRRWPIGWLGRSAASTGSPVAAIVRRAPGGRRRSPTACRPP